MKHTMTPTAMIGHILHYHWIWVIIALLLILSIFGTVHDGRMRKARYDQCIGECGQISNEDMRHNCKARCMSKP